MRIQRQRIGCVRRLSPGMYKHCAFPATHTNTHWTIYTTPHNDTVANTCVCRSHTQECVKLVVPSPRALAWACLMFQLSTITSNSLMHHTSKGFHTSSCATLAQATRTQTSVLISMEMPALTVRMNILSVPTSPIQRCLLHHHHPVNLGFPAAWTVLAHLDRLALVVDLKMTNRLDCAVRQPAMSLSLKIFDHLSFA